MRIKKMFQGTVPENKILNMDSDSQTDTYSCAKINEMASSGGGSGVSIDMIYPVGSIYISASNTVDPNVIFTGTQWERFGKGRTLVGVNEEDDDFVSVGLEGGHKDIQAHSHTGTTNTDGAHYHTLTAFKANGDNSATLLESWGTYGSTRSARIPHTGTNGTHSHAFTTDNYGEGDSGNLQPFITVFMWKRVA